MSIWQCIIVEMEQKQILTLMFDHLIKGFPRTNFVNDENEISFFGRLFQKSIWNFIDIQSSQICLIKRFFLNNVKGICASWSFTH